MGVYGIIIHDINMQRMSFGVVEVFHENRASNVDAHTLARSNVQSECGRHIWF